MTTLVTSKRGILLFLLVCLIDLFLVWGMSRNGIGIGPDSTIYYGAAKNLLAGRGLLMPVLDIPLTHFPPLYSIMLSLSAAVGAPMLVWAKWLNLLFLVGNLVIALLISRRLIPGGSFLPIILIATSRSFLEIHLMAWSESSYIFFSFASIFCMFLYQQRNRAWLLCLSGFLCALAWLDRYIGLGLFLTLSVGILTFSSNKKRDLFLFGMIALSPILLLLSYNLLVSGRSVDRQLSFLPVTPVEAGIMIGLSVCGLAAHLYLRWKQANSLLSLLALYLFFYAAVLAFTVCLADPDTLVLDFRILAPVFFVVYLLLIPFIYLFTRRPRYFLSVVACIILLQVLYFGPFVRAVLDFGLTEASGEWRWGELYIPPHDWR